MLLFTGSILGGVAIGIINVLVPGLIKRDFPNRISLMLGVHAMMLCAGGALGAGAAVPLEQVFDGSWGASLAFWGLPALASFLLWLPLVPKRSAEQTGARFHVRGLWRDGLAWQVTLFMAFQSAIFYVRVGMVAADPAQSRAESGECRLGSLDRHSDSDRVIFRSAAIGLAMA